ncbi:MAG TPA: ATP-binding protein [Bryobacteraceae bacterium]
MVLWWGKSNLTQFYNDAYISYLGAAKHPYSLGRSGRECWSEIWQIIAPMLESVFETGEATWSEDLLLIMNRNLPSEETYFTFSYSPIWDDFGNIGGIFCSCIETTGRVIGERRLRTLRDLGRMVMKAKTGEEACELTAKTLADNRADIPFALIYLVDDQGPQAHLVATMGIKPGNEATPARIDLHDADCAVWPLHEVFETGSAKLVKHLERSFESLPGGPWPESPEVALVLPIAAAGQARPIGFFIAGLSPRRVIDADYRSFLELIAGHVATAVANARAAEEERRRAAALAELDRAKTQFFSNVSHEFRTPLTLLLGPLEAVLAKQGAILPADRPQIETAHRNSLRLLKLVNSLLDFSRIEAGRVGASFEPVDLASFTADLASNFRSAMEAGGLEFRVDCRPLAEPVYVDREMWEKVVLNLLSNAFKFTFQGQVNVSLRSSSLGSGNAQAILTVSDTGVGIPEEELPHIFERFHRVEASRGRTYEGTGIGLALIQELVKLHGGTIGVESRLGEGSAFQVSLPFGSAHLPQDRIASRDEARAINSWTAVRAAAFTGEAMTWIADAGPTGPDTSSCDTALGETGSEALQRSRILLADDNSDMREHVAHILGSQYDLVAVADGRAALEQARRRRPDLILSDIMMPQLDGLGLLQELRADPQLREVPVILLSARAGEEARRDGIGRGADDYLTKPFSAAELNVRVRNMLSLRSIRRQSSEAIAALNDELNADLLAMNRMQQLGTRLVQADELDVLLGEVLDAAIEITRADKGSIRLFQGGRLRICQQRGFEAPFLDFFNSEQGNLAWGVALEHGERVIVEDVAQSPIFKESKALEVLLAAGALAVQSTPLISRSGQVFGRISTYYGQAPRKPAERELRLLDLLARQASDLIERNANQAALRANEQRYRSLAEQVSDGIFVVDNEGRYIDANRAGYEMLGYTLEELRTLSLWDVLAADEVRRLAEQFERLDADESVRCDCQFKRKDDSVFTGELIGRQLPDGGFQGVVRDMTERKEEEDKYRETQKLETLGVLAGGIAHDFNNLLTGILGNASLLADRLRDLPEEGMAQALIEASERMARLTQQMLAYSGKGHFVIAPLDLSHEVTRIATLIQASIPKRVELQLNLVENLPLMQADGGQIQQLIMNLVINAAEAITADTGTVSVSTTVEKLGEARLEGNMFPQNAQPGSYVVLSVADNGCGMNEETKRKIFDPFFTTKFIGRGLGLSAVLGIVRGHEGLLTVDSSPGRGTTFKVLFPVRGQREKLGDHAPLATAVAAGRGTILVVDDEDVVLQVARTSLERAGYRILTSSNGRQALELFQGHRHEIKLVILDLTMPVMGGAETLRQLRQIDPDALVIGSSGYDESNAAIQFGAGTAAHLQKPYRARFLIQKVWQVLERSARSKSESQ